MNLNKHQDFFNPYNYEKTIHIIGVGAIGSNIANQLIRLGFDNLILYDFDVINSHNITNQLYTQEDIGELKTEALRAHLLKINPKATILVENKGWKPKTYLNDIVISAVDSVELRKKIISTNLNNPNILCVLDMRIALSEAQMYFANWQKETDRKKLISTMQFKDSEAEVPVSACGIRLTVLPTIQTIVSMGVMNLINFLKTKNYNYQTTIDTLIGVANSQK